MVIGIIEYIFGHKHEMERSTELDLIKEGLCLGKGVHMDVVNKSSKVNDGFTKKLIK